MKKLLLCCSILVVANVYAATSKHKVSGITADQVAQQIQTAGAQSTMAQLKHAPTGKNWKAVAQQIETGKEEWLVVAGQLSRGLNDFATGNELRKALSIALSKNPAGVLRLVNGNPIDIPYVCSAAIPNRSSSSLRNYVGKTIPELNKVNDPNLRQYVQQCIAKLQQAVAIERALGQKEHHKEVQPEPVTEPQPEPQNKAPEPQSAAPNTAPPAPPKQN